MAPLAIYPGADMNQQRIEKRSKHAYLEVHSIFDTIQGEGPFCGTPAVFIRLAGCNLQCPACDTDYTSRRANCQVSLVMSEVQALRTSGLVVITGGEPFRQDLNALIRTLVDAGYYVQIETNGSLAPPDYFGFHDRVDTRYGAYIVVSPKAGKVHPRTAREACCFKYVLAANSVASDGLPRLALAHPAHPMVARPPLGYDRPIYLQPQDDKDPVTNAANLKACVESCMTHGYILQLQVHKIINME
jgi:7-carboxy-7-deazaguanine synthase